jgi:preprotein translocase subunit YajC
MNEILNSIGNFVSNMSNNALTISAIAVITTFYLSLFYFLAIRPYMRKLARRKARLALAA